MRKLPYILSVLLSCLSVQALIAYDDASDIVYSDGWDNMDNGGNGFGAWVMNSWSNVQSNYFGISSSTDNDGTLSTNNIDTDSVAFKIMNSTETNGYIEIFRYLNNPLKPGEKFSFKMDVNWRDGYSGIRLRDLGEITIFRLEVGDWLDGGGDATWVADTNEENRKINSEYSNDTQYLVTLNQLSPSNGNWNVIRTGGITDYDSGTYTGKVASLQLYSSLVSSNLYSDIFFNNFSVDFIPDFDHYGNWISSYDLSGTNSLKSSDPDADGLNNETEFAYGSDPLIPDNDSFAPSYFIQNNNFVYIYRRWREAYAEEYEITYDLQITDNLIYPDWTVTNITISNSIDFDNMYTVTNSIPIDSNHKYIRHRLLFGN